MERKLIESKIFDLQDKLEICEIALNEVNDCDELEPAYKDIIKAYREHISDLEEFLKLLPIQRVSNLACFVDESTHHCTKPEKSIKCKGCRHY